MSTDQNDLVVSSAHLADGSFPEVSEFEFGLILVSHGFERWMVRAMAAAGMPDMSPLEVWFCIRSTIGSAPKNWPTSAWC